MERVLGLRDFSNMRLPQELLLWEQMSAMLQVPQLFLGTGWDCASSIFMNTRLWWVLWLWAVLQAREMSSQ